MERLVSKNNFLKFCILTALMGVATTLPAGQTNKFEEALVRMGGVPDSVTSWPIYGTILDSCYFKELCNFVGAREPNEKTAVAKIMMKALMHESCSPHVGIVVRKGYGSEWMRHEDFARRVLCDFFLEYYKQWEAPKAKDLCKQLTDQNSLLRKTYLEDKTLERVVYDWCKENND